MSRSGYSEVLDDNWHHIRYRGQVASAIRGKRGQAMLKNLLAALDAMEDKKLCAHEMQRPDGRCCALGALGKAQGLDLSQVDPDWVVESGELSSKFDAANQLIREIVWENDECTWSHWWPVKDENVNEDGLTKSEYEDRADARRWSNVRAWVVSKIKDPIEGVDE